MAGTDTLSKGLNAQMDVGQKKPRGATEKGQVPQIKREGCSSDRGKFTIKQ